MYTRLAIRTVSTSVPKLDVHLPTQDSYPQCSSLDFVIDLHAHSTVVGAFCYVNLLENEDVFFTLKFSISPLDFFFLTNLLGKC